MNREFEEALENSPIIAAVKDDAGLKKCLTCDSSIIFVLYGDVCTIPEIVAEIKKAGKLAVVHIDLIQGLSGKEITVDFIRKYTRADGIITTKPALVRRAAELKLFTVLRFFVIDSMAFDSIPKQLRSVKPDVIEILPALMPKVVSRICGLSKTPVITGGLVTDREDVVSLLNAGAVCVSSTNENVWFL